MELNSINCYIFAGGHQLALTLLTSQQPPRPSSLAQILPHSLLSL